MLLLVSLQDAGGIAAATIVGVPKKPLHLPTNYRTHSGILNAAAAVVDVLRQYFPMVTNTNPQLHWEDLLPVSLYKVGWWSEDWYTRPHLHLLHIIHMWNCSEHSLLHLMNGLHQMQ